MPDRRSASLLGVLAIAIGGLAGCQSSDPVSGSVPPLVVAPLAALEEHSDVADLDAPPAFELVPLLSGALGTGRSISIGVRIRPRFEVGAYVANIHMPELTVELSDDRNALNRGERIEPIASQRGVALQGADQTLTAVVTIHEPGYYRISMSVHAEALGEPLRNRGVQGTVHREAWLYVDEAGGMLTEEFDRALLRGKGYVESPGPFRSLRQNNRPTGQGLRSAALGSTDGNDYFRVLYFDVDAQAYMPVPDAMIDVIYWGEVYGDPYQIGYSSALSNAAGEFEIQCNMLDSSQWYEFQVTGMGNADVKIVGTGWFGGGGGSGGEFCGTYATSANPASVYPYSLHSRVFTHLRANIPVAEAYFQTSRSQLKVRVNGGTGTSYYSSGSDEVVIYSNGVWGDYGKFLGMHEFGHALWHGGMNGNPVSGACPAPHYASQLTNFACALSEGWANYVAAASGFDGGYGWEDTDRTFGCLTYNSQHQCTSSSSTRDGSRVEGAVASMLLNLTDASNSTNDSTSYPGKYVADLLKTCTLYPGIPVRVLGVDHLVYCLELGVDGTIASNYFQARATPPYFVIGENATEPFDWSISRIRQVWKWNLYRE